MRFALAILAVAASSASASLVARQLPSCANNCLFGPSVDLGGCGPTDNVCLCKSQTFVSKSTACISAACQGADLQAALTAAQGICASVGVTLTGSVPAASSTSAAASQSTPTAPSASSTRASTSASRSGSATAATSAPAATKSSGASTNAAGTLMGMAAFGLVALAL